MNVFVGAVKLTPAHDPTDHDVGVSHRLEFINVIDDEGSMLHVPQPFLVSYGIQKF